MKKRLLAVALCVAALIAAVHAQDITGIWQGTMQNAQGREGLQRHL